MGWSTMGSLAMTCRPYSPRANLPFAWQQAKRPRYSRTPPAESGWCPSGRLLAVPLPRALAGRLLRLDLFAAVAFELRRDVVVDPLLACPRTIGGARSV